MCMLWGGIGKRPMSNKSKMTEIAKKAFTDCCNNDKSEKIFMGALHNSKDCVRELYLSLETSGEKKIPEVDVSYFTKIIAFGSEASSNKFKFLIYDKWTKLIHVHIMYDISEDPENFYTKNSINKLYCVKKCGKPKVTDLINPKSKLGWYAYENYCQAMAKLAEELSQEVKDNIGASKLESFLFGHELTGKANKTEANPRYWIQQNFANKYLYNKN